MIEGLALSALNDIRWRVLCALAKTILIYTDQIVTVSQRRRFCAVFLLNNSSLSKLGK